MALEMAGTKPDIGDGSLLEESNDTLTPVKILGEESKTVNDSLFSMSSEVTNTTANKVP